MNPDQKSTLVKEFSDENSDPIYFYGNGDYLILVVSVVSSSGAIFKVYESEDLGNNWRKVPIPIPDYVHPIASYKEKTWIYSGAGRIQIRN